MPRDDSILRMLRGQRAAGLRQMELLRKEGPRPKQAVAEALSAVEALSLQGKWPAPRDPIAERGVEEVRRRWVLIKRNSMRQMKAQR